MGCGVIQLEFTPVSSKHGLWGDPSWDSPHSHSSTHHQGAKPQMGEEMTRPGSPCREAGEAVLRKTKGYFGAMVTWLKKP